MVKAPKAKKAALHYQPYQANISSESDEPSMDLGMTDIPLQLDPVLSGLSSNMSRNLWEDWNEGDASFDVKFNMLTDKVDTASSSEIMTDLHSSIGSGYEQQQSVSNSTMHLNFSPNSESSAFSTTDVAGKPRLNIQRSLSEEIVNMLDENNEAALSKQLDGNQRGIAPSQSLMFNADRMTAQHQKLQSQYQPHSNTQYWQQYQQQLQLQQQFQQQQHIQREASDLHVANWMNSFGVNQITAATNPAASTKSSDPSTHRVLPNSANYDYAEAEKMAAVKSTSFSFSQQSTSSNGESKKAVASGPKTSSGGLACGNATIKTSNAAINNSYINMTYPPQHTNGLGPQGMMINPFLMFPMMGPQAMNMMGMPIQMPMGINVNAMNSMNGANAMNNASGLTGMNYTNGMHDLSGTPLSMHLQLQMQFQMQMAQMAQMNGMGLHGMSMPSGFANLPMSLNMQIPLNVQHQINPQSGLANDANTTSEYSMGMFSTEGKLPKPNGANEAFGGGSGFVSIAKKPDEPGVSSILKSLMTEEAKKKEKKLERNRDSARESRKKQQTYVETLENGIKRLQINREFVRSYQWGISSPGFSFLTCPNSLQMIDWKNRINVVTGQTEAFASIQNPANFWSLMQLNRQRRTLAMQHEDRERAVWKCFVYVGRQLNGLRTRVLQMQMLRSLSQSALTQELEMLLNLSADQKFHLQSQAHQIFNQEVMELTKLFKIFFVLRNEALRLNMVSPFLEAYFREVCSFDQLQKLLQWTETHRSIILEEISLDET
ncbi:uncharacterized protein CCR75_006085 [Bremia lactucae]|uniref:BZIP domain-containing protein n=1 Tax=Bremia lactucae TaxID=4779 RepID=A0A976ICE7_BRELC|nr:hypothetical protein CCR75_006085 [Bremia lactucae]